MRVALSVTSGGYHALTKESMQDIRWSMQGYRKALVLEVQSEALMLNMLQRLIKFCSKHTFCCYIHARSQLPQVRLSMDCSVVLKMKRRLLKAVGPFKKFCSSGSWHFFCGAIISNDSHCAQTHSRESIRLQKTGRRFGRDHPFMLLSFLSAGKRENWY